MDKVVLITGAGAGMGKASALKYAALNAKLSIADIDVKGLEETSEDCSILNGGNVLTTIIDITKDDDVKTLVDNTINKFGKIDILVNCAGIIRSSNLLDSSLMEVYDKVMAVNLRSIVLLTSLCAPHLIQSKGSIINIASAAAVKASDNYSLYSVSKAGVDHFTRCSALELAGHGVRVNSILPGIVTSKLYVNSGLTENESQDFITNVVSMTPLNQSINTSEIADLVLFLGSDNARSITGSSYVIDGGLVLN